VEQITRLDFWSGLLLGEIFLQLLSVSEKIFNIFFPEQQFLGVTYMSPEAKKAFKKKAENPLLSMAG